MPTTDELTNSVRGRYIDDYNEAVYTARLYDAYCYPISEEKAKLQKSTSVTVPFLSAMTPGSAAISQSVDITPQSLRDATASVSPSSRGEAIQDSELLLLQAYTDYGSMRFKVIAENMIETVEAYLLETAMNGSIAVNPAARASLDAGTTTHELTHKTFATVKSHLENLKCPGFIQKPSNSGSFPNTFSATGHTDAYYDFRTNTPILEIGEYQKAEIILNGEKGMYEGFRIVASAFSKVFGGAGLDNGSVVATTLSSAAEALSKTIVVASAANITVGRYITLGTEETASTLYPTNERLLVVSASSTTITIVGTGSNGGLKYDHASGSAVRNADSVYPILFGGPRSIAKVYATEVGEYGEVVGPERSGLLKQFVSLGWKWYGGFGIINQNWLGRAEVSSSLDA